MVITKTPLRISFFGGGTDYPNFYNKYGGCVLTTSINKYSYVSVKELHDIFEYNYRITYSKIESVKDIDEIEHPSVRECLRFVNNTKKLEISYSGDLPARTGLGSSSSFTVGLLNALYSLDGIKLTQYELAKIAIDIEQNKIKENVGSQDQISTSMGGINYIKFEKDNFDIEPIFISEERKKELKNKFLLLYTGKNRIASDILVEQIEKTKNGDNDKILFKMKDLVTDGLDILCSNKNLDDFGNLLHENWELKKQLSSKISNDYIDNIYQKAIQNGAIGGKLLGAGESGFILLYCHENKKELIKKSLNLFNVNFDFESKGTSVIYHQ